ncbi:unnamed protein product, partial [Discosporangium mesarthrocarpum]
VKNLIGGRFTESNASEWIDVINPANQDVVCRVPQSTQEEMATAVWCAEEAFGSWREVPVQQRQRVMFKLQQLIRSAPVGLGVG